MMKVKKKKYMINEVFYSVQGEGMRAGDPSVFVRFSKCNMECTMEEGPRSPGGFDCDTEFESGRMVDLDQLNEWVEGEWMASVRGGGEKSPWIVFTGGEPALQLDNAMCFFFREKEYRIAVETNGSILLPHFTPIIPCGGLQDTLDLFPINWITVSPKVAEHAIRQRWAHEVKYVRGFGQEIPKTKVEALHRLISPAFNGLTVDQRTVDWCVTLVKKNPEWRLTAQLHKLLVQR